MRDDVAAIKEQIEYVSQDERLEILTDELCQIWSTNDDAEYIKALLVLLLELESGS